MGAKRTRRRSLTLAGHVTVNAQISSLMVGATRPHKSYAGATRKPRGTHTGTTRESGCHAGATQEPRGNHAGAMRELIWAFSGTSARKRSQNVAAAKQNNSYRLGYLLGTCGFLK